MEMLAYAQVLTKSKRGNRNYYKVNNKEILEYIAYESEMPFLPKNLYRKDA